MSGDLWSQIIIEIFGTAGHKFCSEAWPLIIAVEEGIKPAFLWDVSWASDSQIAALIQTASANSLISNQIKVMRIDLDVFIINVGALFERLVDLLNSQKSWLIDISTSEPKIATRDTHLNFSKHLVSILNQLGLSHALKDSGILKEKSLSDLCDNSDCNALTDSTVTLSFPDDTNLCTMFGCMLGYPQVYWWDEKNGEYCLTGVPLKVFKFSAQFSPGDSEIELFSYSIPEPLEKDLRSDIELWGNKLNTVVEKSEVFLNTKFKCDSVLCLSVAL